MAPGANIGSEMAMFEPIHGSAPKYAGKNKVNPTATILSGALMLRHLGETEAAARVEKAVAQVIAEGKSVTYDLKPHRDDPTAGTTMCGHHQISPALVRYLRKLVRADKMEPEAAARRLATFCPCGIFNHRRAARLLTE